MTTTVLLVADQVLSILP